LSTSILVSFCNTRRGAPLLGLVDPKLCGFRPVSLPAWANDHVGITGLAKSGDFVYVGLQESRNLTVPVSDSMVILDRHTLSIRDHFRFACVKDIHSLFAEGEVLWAVSTGTDEVVRVSLDHGMPQHDDTVAWRPAGEPGADRFHLNAIARIGNALVVSGFGEKSADSWGEVTHGFIADISTSEMIATGIEHPHSVTSIHGNLAYCESRTRSVWVGGHRLIGGLFGYVRGLCFHDDAVFVGTSVGRRVAGNVRLIGNIDDSGAIKGRCTVVRIGLETGRVEQSIDLTAFGTELYDLLPLDKVTV
jgi:hypothetical protein